MIGTRPSGLQTPRHLTSSLSHAASSLPTRGPGSHRESERDFIPLTEEIDLNYKVETKNMTLNIS